MEESAEVEGGSSTLTILLAHYRFLCVDKRPSVHSLLHTGASHIADEPSDELLDLCSGTFATQEAARVGMPLPHRKPLSGLLSSLAVTKSASEGTQETDVLALCSGVFPSSPGKEAPDGDGDVEGGRGEGNVLERWALRHSQPAETPGEVEESEDEDMPFLLKRRTSLPKPKPTARCVGVCGCSRWCFVTWSMLSVNDFRNLWRVKLSCLGKTWDQMVRKRDLRGQMSMRRRKVPNWSLCSLRLS